MTPCDADLLDYLLTFLTARRRTRFAQVLSQRTRRLTVVLEDLFQSHNISAVLRSCDAFGIQDTHVVESRNPYEPVPEIAAGSEQWLSVHRYDSTSDCLDGLRAAGYRIAATIPGPDATPLEEIDVTRPLALWFGTEKEGLTREVIEAADERITIPMYGFVRSFNISVAAAICLHRFTDQLRRSGGEWGLTEEEQAPILLEWCRATIPNVDAIEERYFLERQKAAESETTKTG